MEFNKILCVVAVAGVFAMEVNVAEGGRDGREEVPTEEQPLKKRARGENIPPQQASQAEPASPQTSV